MTEEKKVTQGGGKPNPPTEQKADAPGKQEPQPQKEQGSSADLTSLKAQLDEMNGKLERYKEQVSGSSKEALRLKEENDALQKRIEELEKSKVAHPNADFQKIMEDQGLEAAVLHAVKGEIASLQTKVDKYEEDEAERTLNEFKATHKGLADPKVLEAFDRELAKLGNVYDNVEEAMEKAYLLAGGPQAEKAPEPPPSADPQKGAEEERVLKNVTGGEEDKKLSPKPAGNAGEIQKRIEDLQYEAMTLQNSGRIRQAAEVLSKVEDLKAQLGEKV
jgi:hypothetical protein